MSDQGSHVAAVSEMQRLLEAAVARGGPAATAAGSRQPELLAPLTEAELEAGGGYVCAISSVDMTPRPRYRESPAAFAARMRAMGADLAELTREVKLRNRKAALRMTAGGDLVWTQCACGWCGLRVTDPEVARREYDAHDCAAAGVGQSAVDRAIAETDKVTLAKRTKHVLQPALTKAAADMTEAERLDLERSLAAMAGPREYRQVKRDVEVVDDAGQRFALLELK